MYFLTRLSNRINFNPQKEMFTTSYLFLTHWLRQAYISICFSFTSMSCPDLDLSGPRHKEVCQLRRVSSFGGIMVWKSPGSHWFAAAARLHRLPLGWSVWHWAGRGSSSWRKTQRLLFSAYSPFCNSCHLDFCLFKCAFIWEESNALHAHKERSSVLVML